MKSLLTLCCLLLTAACVAQNFEGVIKWSVTNEITDPAMKAKMEEGQKMTHDPANQAKMKEMKEKMNDPQFKAMMESNPQMKAQMESMMKMSEGGGMNSMMPTGFTVKIKNGNTLTSMEGGMMANNETLYKKDKNQTYFLNKGNKTYTVLNQGNQASGHMQGEVKITKTAETQKILNYNCSKTIVTITDKGKSIDQIFWTTTEIKDLDLKSLAKQRMGAGQSMFYENIEGIPLKIEMTMPQAKMIMVVTEIKKEAVSTATFEIPSDFTESKLPGQ
ncbi:MAG: DUF4412 domain-containing protein [Flammeovirgaceae bacterium]|nr:DUF4412 domain-containing protein [Flammeovirgaceae bacterium]